MYFREYSDNSSTLKEWSRQLNVVSQGNYPLYSTVEQTLSHWQTILNQNIGTNTFGLLETPETTIKNWQNKLNIMYNK